MIYACISQYQIGIGTVPKNSEILKYVPNQIDTEKCVSMQLKNWSIY